MAYQHPACKHPQDQRRPLTGGKVHCGACSRTFTSPAVPPRHGTVRGYHRHKRTRKGKWGWPVAEGSCGCLEAIRTYNREVRSTAEQVAARHVRDAARQSALLDLRRQFPGEYQRHYDRQLAERDYRGPRGKAMRPDWEDILSQLVKAALDKDEHEVTQRVLNRWASPRERAVVRLVWRVRALLSARDT